MFFKLPQVDDLPENADSLPDRVVPFIWYFVRQAWPAFLFMAVIFAVANSMTAAVPYFIKLTIDAFATVENRADIWRELFWVLFWFVALVLILESVLDRYGNYLMAKVRPAFTNMIRRQLALHMHKHSYEYFQSDFAGRLASKVVETPDAISLIMQMFVGSIWFTLVTLLVSVVLFMSAHWGFGLITGIWMTAYFLLLRHYIPRILETSKRDSDNKSIIRGRYVDTLTNVLTVKLFARWKHEDAYLREALDDTTLSGQDMLHTINSMYIWMEVVIVFFMGAVFAASVYFWQYDLITVGDVAMVLPMMIRLSTMSWWMSDVFTTLFSQLGQVEEGMETITRTHAVIDNDGAEPLKATQGHIRFDDVHFSYGAKPVFEKLSVDIPSGQKIGLVGSSGAGKSTFIQILLRLYDLQGGKIVIDGQNIAEVGQDSLREQIAVIPQMSDLLHRSIRDNIRYGRLDATDEDVIEAAKKAHAHDFIMELEDNEGNLAYDAKVGERGVKLSGGQRQRVAIARAVLKNAPILILDEATSSLDSESERLIQDSLKTLMEGKTVIVIAHRLSTIAHLDRLIVMDEGRIIEDGSHKALLTGEGLYARLWNMQSGGFIGSALVA